MSDTVIIQAIQMIESQDLTHWSDAHDKVVLRLLKAALAALQPEPTIKESLTVAEQSRELDAGMAAQHYCLGLWGAARGHSDWRKVHEHFANGYKQGQRHDRI